LCGLNAFVNNNALSAFCKKLELSMAAETKHRSRCRSINCETSRKSTKQNTRSRALGVPGRSVVTVFQRLAGFFKSANKRVSLCLQPHVLGMSHVEHLAKHQS
jgi:hypothetical protein